MALLKTNYLKLIMENEFDYKGHHYQVVGIEGSTDYLIIKDGRQTRRVSESIAKNAMQNVDKLFV